MQIREQGNKIQLIRTHYVQAKKRTEGKVFDRFDKYMSTIPDSIRQNLTEEEVDQLETYLSDRKKQGDSNLLKMYLSNVARYAEGASKSLTINEIIQDFDQSKAIEIFTAMTELKKALKKAGFSQTKPTLETKPADTKTIDLFPEK